MFVQQWSPRLQTLSQVFVFERDNTLYVLSCFEDSSMTLEKKLKAHCSNLISVYQGTLNVVNCLFHSSITFKTCSTTSSEYINSTWSAFSGIPKNTLYDIMDHVGKPYLNIIIYIKETVWEETYALAGKVLFHKNEIFNSVNKLRVNQRLQKIFTFASSENLISEAFNASASFKPTRSKPYFNLLDKFRRPTMATPYVDGMCLLKKYIHRLPFLTLACFLLYQILGVDCFYVLKKK